MQVTTKTTQHKQGFPSKHCDEITGLTDPIKEIESIPRGD